MSDRNSVNIVKCNLYWWNFTHKNVTLLNTEADKTTELIKSNKLWELINKFQIYTWIQNDPRKYFWIVTDPPAVYSTGKKAVAYNIKIHRADTTCFSFHKYDILPSLILTQVVQHLFCCQGTILLLMYTKTALTRDYCYPSVLLNTQYLTRTKILTNLANLMIFDF